MNNVVAPQGTHVSLVILGVSCSSNVFTPPETKPLPHHHHHLRGQTVSNGQTVPSTTTKMKTIRRILPTMVDIVNQAVHQNNVTSEGKVCQLHIFILLYYLYVKTLKNI